MALKPRRCGSNTVETRLDMVGIFYGLFPSLGLKNSNTFAFLLPQRVKNTTLPQTHKYHKSQLYNKLDMEGE